jgi:hypothetical protein
MIFEVLTNWLWKKKLVTKIIVNFFWNNPLIINKYLSMKDKVVCLFYFVLFCFVLMRSTKPGCFRSCSWSLWKALDDEGCMGLVPWRLDLRCKVLEYGMISSLKINLNFSWKFRRNWNVPLVLLERSWWAEFNGIYLVRFGFRMWEIFNFKWFLLLKIQINSKNQVLEGKISWGRGNAWANGIGHTSLIMC